MKKGKYGKNNLIKKILLEFKEITKGTEKEFLFNSLNESIKIDTIRKKSLYIKSKTGEYYNRLTDYIYEKSFIDKLTIVQKRIDEFWEESNGELTLQKLEVIEKMIESAKLQDN